MSTSKIKSVTMGESEWERVKLESGTEYHHTGGWWVVRKVSHPSYKKKFFRGIWVGPKLLHTPLLPLSDTLREAVSQVDNWLLAVGVSPRIRAILAVEKGEYLLALDCIFDYIDSKFNELEDQQDQLQTRVGQIERKLGGLGGHDTW